MQQHIMSVQQKQKQSFLVMLQDGPLRPLRTCCTVLACLPLFCFCCLVSAFRLPIWSLVLYNMLQVPLIPQRLGGWSASCSPSQAETASVSMTTTQQAMRHDTVLKHFHQNVCLPQNREKGGLNTTVSQGSPATPLPMSR